MLHSDPIDKVLQLSTAI